jgi:hypothetical protein
MGNLKGLVSIVSDLRAARTNLVTQLKHIDAALSVLGKLNGGRFYTKPRHTLSAAARRKDQPGAKSTMGEESVYEQPSNRSKPEANYVNRSSQEDRSVSAS